MKYEYEILNNEIYSVIQNISFIIVIDREKIKKKTRT